MKLERLNQLSSIYRRERAEAQETIVIALCETYRDITGAWPDDRLKDRLADAIEYGSR
jgi:DNA-binding TFAR19-related protein (PDSD5 family)